MTILIPIFIGLYLILAIGYAKMVERAVPDFWEEARVIIALVSLIWPVAIVYTLIREAVT